VWSARGGLLTRAAGYGPDVLAAGGMQYTVEAALRANIAASISQPRHDLTRPEGGQTSAVTQLSTIGPTLSLPSSALARLGGMA